VRENGIYGAFVLREQKTSPESAQYSWWYSRDGNGILDNSNVMHGVSQTVQPQNGVASLIEFGPFAISWSAASKGQGWLYYKNLPGMSENDFHICVTRKISIDGMNATNPQWNYTSSPVTSETPTM